MSRVESKLDWSYSSNISPAPGISPTYFCSRFSFYMSVPTSQLYYFYLQADDAGALYIDQELTGSVSCCSEVEVNTTLAAGYHSFLFVQCQITGASVASVHWDAGLGSSNRQSLPWGSVSPLPPGMPASIEVTVNGARAIPACTSSQAVTNPDNLPALAFQPSTVPLPADQCSFVYSSYRTPTLTLPTSTVVNAPGLITLSGSLLAGSDPSSYNVTVAGVACTNLTVDALATVLTCNLPALPAGTWPLVVDVVGLGSVVWSDGTYSVSLRYNTGFSSVVMNRGSFWGGGLFQLNGYGFAPSSGVGALNMTNVVLMTSSYPGNSPLPATVLNATTSTMWVQLGYFSAWSLPGVVPSSRSSNLVLRVYAMVSQGMLLPVCFMPAACRCCLLLPACCLPLLPACYCRLLNFCPSLPSSAVQGQSPIVGGSTASLTYVHDKTYTPFVTNPAPTTAQPSTGALPTQLTLNWNMAQNISSLPLYGFTSVAAGSASPSVQVFFQYLGGAVYPCGTPTVQVGGGGGEGRGVSLLLGCNKLQRWAGWHPSHTCRHFLSSCPPLTSPHHCPHPMATAPTSPYGCCPPLTS